MRHIRRRVPDRCAGLAEKSAIRSSINAVHSPGAMTGRLANRSVRSATGLPGSKATSRAVAAVTSGSCAFDVAHQVPEAGRPAGVDDEMNAVLRARVDDPMPPPGVEDPALAGLHVQLLLATVEDHRRVGDDRDVDAHAAEPVVVEVHMQTELGACVELHQPGTRQDLAETRHDLAHVFAHLEVRSGLLLAFEGVFVGPAARDQRDGRVAGQTAGMGHPSLRAGTVRPLPRVARRRSGTAAG